MYTTYYIIERGEIVNAVETTSLAKAEEVAARMIGDNLTVERNPPPSVLQRYYYWTHRP